MGCLEDIREDEKRISEAWDRTHEYLMSPGAIKGLSYEEKRKLVDNIKKPDLFIPK